MLGFVRFTLFFLLFYFFSINAFHVQQDFLGGGRVEKTLCIFIFFFFVRGRTTFTRVFVCVYSTSQKIGSVYRFLFCNSYFFHFVDFS